MTLLVACGGGGPPLAPVAKDFEPAPVTPTIAADAIPEEAEVFVSTSDDAVIRWVEEHAGAALARGSREALAHHPGEPGRYWLSRVGRGGDTKVVFVLRRVSDTRAVIFATSDDLLVPSVSWVGLALNVRSANGDELKAWQREMARRIATKRRATGIVVFPNGNAQAVILDEQPDERAAGDIQLVARRRFMKAGTFDPNVWGPRIAVDNEARVVTSKAGTHDGISVSDMMKRAPAPAAPP